MAANVTTATLELNAVDNVTATIQKVGRSVEGLGQQYQRLSTNVLHLAEAFGAVKLLEWVNEAVEAANRLREMALATGVNVETLSALTKVAAQSGTGMEQVGTMVQRLSKNMYTFATEGTGPAAKAFEQLGITQDEARAGMTDMNTFLPQFAKRLIESGTATEQVAMAQLLMGRSGAQALPFLHQLAESGELVAKITAEQAEQAHAYHLRLVELQEGAEKLKIQMATGLLPSLTQILDAFIELKGKQGDFVSFFEVMGTVAKYVAGILASLWLALKDMGDGLGAIAAQAAAIAHGDFAGAAAIGRARDQNAAANEAQYNAMWARLQAPAAPLPAAHGGGNALSGAPGAEAQGKLWTLADEEMFQARRAAYKESDAMTAEQQKLLDELVKAGERHEADLQKQAEALRNLIDPTRKWVEAEIQAQALLADGKISQDEATKAIQNYHDQIDKLNQTTPQTDDFAKKMGLTFSSAFESAIVKGKALRDVITGIGQDIAGIIVRMTITQPAGQAISNAISSSGITDWAKGLFTGPHAAGGFIPPGMWGTAGEEGPEAVFGGSSGMTVLPNRSLGGGGQMVINADMRGASDAAVARFTAWASRFEATFDRRAVGAVQRAYNSRGVATPTG